MDKLKKIWIAIFGILFLLIIYNAPYRLVFPKNYGEQFIGYGTLFSPPYISNTAQKKFAQIDYSRISLEFIGIVVFCGVGYIITDLYQTKN